MFNFKFQIRIDNETLKRIEKISKKKGISKSEFIRRSILKQLTKEEKK
ncbi:ribbon-helix-helix protein, CopG family [Persephonella sp.]